MYEELRGLVTATHPLIQKHNENRESIIVNLSKQKHNENRESIVVNLSKLSGKKQDSKLHRCTHQRLNYMNSSVPLCSIFISTKQGKKDNENFKLCILIFLSQLFLLFLSLYKNTEVLLSEITLIR